MENLPTRNKNPGDLKDPATGKFREFSDPQSGFNALKSDLQGKITGNTHTGLNGNSTLSQFASVYAPSSDGNDSVGYAQKLASKLGVKTETPIGSLSNRLDDFASAIADNEGYQGNRVSGASEKAPAAQELSGGSGTTGSMSLDDFGRKVQAKYPQYANLSPSEVAQKVIAKYPQYKSVVGGSSGNGDSSGNSSEGGFINSEKLPQTPASPNDNSSQQKPGLFQSFIQGATQPFLQGASTVKGLYDVATGNNQDYNDLQTKGQDYGYFGKAKPVGAGFDVTKGVADNAAPLASAIGSVAQGAGEISAARAVISGGAGLLGAITGKGAALKSAAPIISDISGLSQDTFNAASASGKLDALTEALSKSTSASDKMVLQRAIDQIMPAASKELGLEPSIAGKIISKAGPTAWKGIKALLRGVTDVSGLELLNKILK